MLGVTSVEVMATCAGVEEGGGRVVVHGWRPGLVARLTEVEAWWCCLVGSGDDAIVDGGGRCVVWLQALEEGGDGYGVLVVEGDGV